MQHRAEWPLCHFVVENATAILVGLSGVDDQRQPGGAGGGDVGAKTALLRSGRPIVVEVIQPGLAQRHDLRVRRQRNQLLGGNAVLLIRMMRVRADRTIDVWKARRDVEQTLDALHPRRDGHHAADTRGLGAGDDPVQILGEVRKIQMAMTVDQHHALPESLPGPLPLPASSAGST